ncbi:MAG: efflux transporter, family, subunit [Firmicutes bacterium]|nr:efflux transporter, family, subunit [Bacillota bacterium]
MKVEIKHRKVLYVGLIAVALLGSFAVARSGALAKNQAAKTQPVTVKAMQVVNRDTPVNYEFVGKVQAKNEVKIMAKVSGNIVEKMVKGGDTVYKGQPLFRIDNKQYRSAIRSSQAALNKSKATLNNSQKDVARYQDLAAKDAIAQQKLDAQVAQAEEDTATVEANLANLRQAEEDEQDTLIVSPVDGRIDVNDLNVGDYVAAGSTTLANVSTTDPVVVQFSMSENEYIKFIQLGSGSLPASLKDNLKLTLSDGSTYPLSGHIDQIDKGISTTTGTITLKALFSNPQKFLVPGMFARIVAAGEIRPNAILIPERAVKELLDNTFVFVIGADNKAEQRAVKLGDKVGNMVIVEDGLTAGDSIVVDGIDKIKTGTLLNVTMMEPDASANPAQQ